jgi:hypothetical protein
MGWTYKDLMEQPRAFVEQMLEMMEIKMKYELKRYGRR